jgi:hypothetical protein
LWYTPRIIWYQLSLQLEVGYSHIQRKTNNKKGNKNNTKKERRNKTLRHIDFQTDNWTSIPHINTRTCWIKSNNWTICIENEWKNKWIKVECLNTLIPQQSVTNLFQTWLKIYSIIYILGNINWFRNSNFWLKYNKILKIIKIKTNQHLYYTNHF